MPGNSKECRRLAIRCEMLAGKAPNAQLKLSLMELSYIWHTLSAALDKNQALVIETTKPTSPSQNSYPGGY